MGIGKERTWEDFVEDMVSNGRSIKHIKAVCLGTRWWGDVEQIVERAKELRGIFKKPKKLINKS